MRDEWCGRPFLDAFASVARKDQRKEYFFVCDLQDGETGEGIGRVTQFLVSGSTPKRLHIISFDEVPGHYLARLLEATDGTFTYIDPTLGGD